MKQDVKTSEKDIIAYIMKMREQNYSYSSMKVMFSSLFLFFDMNDITLNKKEINRYLGEHTKTIKDRAYTREEIKKLIDACDLKYQVIVSFVVSNSCWIGAIPILRLSALKYIEVYQLYEVTFTKRVTKMLTILSLHLNLLTIF